MEKRLKEIAARKAEIRAALVGGGEVDLEAFKAELTKLEVEERSIQERSEIAAKLNSAEIRGFEIK